MKMMMKAVAALCLFALTSTVGAVTYKIGNAEEFNALPPLDAGDRVILKPGEYGELNKTLQSLIADDATARTNPVLVYAEIPGEAKITRPSKITLTGRGIVLAGLDFTKSSGILNEGSGDLIRLAPNSRYMVLNNLRFKNCAKGAIKGCWVLVNGFNHRIEYCSFEGKNDPIQKPTIGIYPDPSEAGITVPRNHLIRRCWFGPRIISPTDNGYETIRIGLSYRQAYSMCVTVEENVFYRTIWRPDGQGGGESEIISNKSKGNIFRDNTFLESLGQLTLRHGDRGRVEGNYFFGGGRYSGTGIVIAATNRLQAGVRVIGQNHVVRNNYFMNLRGINWNAALCLMGGPTDWDDGDGTYGDGGYEPAHNAQIIGNTFVDCRQMRLGFIANPSTPHLTMPTNSVFCNNVWLGDGSPCAIDWSEGFEVGRSSGNYIYEPKGTFGWMGLTNSTYTSTEPPVVPGIGSFRALTGTGHRPLLRSEVGPLFDGGPAGTYPVP